MRIHIKQARITFFYENHLQIALGLRVTASQAKHWEFSEWECKKLDISIEARSGNVNYYNCSF